MLTGSQTYDDLGVGREPAAQPLETLVLGDGTPIGLRPLESDEREGVLGWFARLSPESRFRRFLSPVPALSSRELAALTDINHVTREAVAAVDQRDGSIVGIAWYVQFGGEKRAADVAIAVIDEVQRMGIGTALGSRLVQRARANCFEVLIATTLRDNRGARALTRRLGFRPRSAAGSELELALELA
jgi:GNAT superfamily N-acetyltransferase